MLEYASHANTEMITARMSASSLQMKLFFFLTKKDNRYRCCFRCYPILFVMTVYFSTGIYCTTCLICIGLISVSGSIYLRIRDMWHWHLLMWPTIAGLDIIFMSIERRIDGFMTDVWAYVKRTGL